MILYRIVLSIAAPVLAVMLLWRWLSGRETWSDMSERLGSGTGQTGAIWVHGASNGELTSARPLIAALSKAHPDRPILVTANTVTGKQLVTRWAMPRLTARLAPLDLRWITARVFRRWQPVALVVLENELWPNRLDLAARKGVPVAVAGARLSERSAARWGRLTGLAQRILGRISYLSAQDLGSSDRFTALGLPRERLGPVLSLKAQVALVPPPEDEVARLRPLFPRAETWLAASTHPSEEPQVFAAFAAARAKRPTLKLILAPRHPVRGPEIAQEAREAGWRVARRGAEDAVDETTDIYLVDTLGEMALWYTLAGTAFVGGSLVAKGGHTPYEPAAAGVAILHGPEVANFAAVYARLDAGGGALMVADASALGQALATMTDAKQADLAARAEAILAEDRAAGLEELVTAIGALIAPD